MSGLPKGYLLRPASLADIPDAQRVLDDAESADCGEPRRHDDKVEVLLRDPRLDISRDTRVVTTPAGSAVPLAAVSLVRRPHTTGEITADHYVHPEHRGRGLCEVMLDEIEARATELSATLAPGVEASLIHWAEPASESHAVFMARGFAVVRQSYEMRFDIGAELAAAQWPAGISPRTLRAGCDEPKVYAADAEAFAEHYLFEPRPYAEWRRSSIERPDFDPGLWLIGWDGDEIAGYVAGVVAEDGGLVENLAVRRPWRRGGLGLALLLEMFRVLAAHGVTVVRLFVDAQNETGAVALYEHAGMRLARRFNVYQKALVRVAPRTPRA